MQVESVHAVVSLPCVFFFLVLGGDLEDSCARAYLWGGEGVGYCDMRGCRHTSGKACGVACVLMCVHACSLLVRASVFMFYLYTCTFVACARGTCSCVRSPSDFLMKIL